MLKHEPRQGRRAPGREAAAAHAGEPQHADAHPLARENTVGMQGQHALGIRLHIGADEGEMRRPHIIPQRRQPAVGIVQSQPAGIEAQAVHQVYDRAPRMLDGIACRVPGSGVAGAQQQRAGVGGLGFLHKTLQARHHVQRGVNIICPDNSDGFRRAETREEEPNGGKCGACVHRAASLA